MKNKKENNNNLNLFEPISSKQGENEKTLLTLLNQADKEAIKLKKLQEESKNIIKEEEKMIIKIIKFICKKCGTEF